MSAMKMKCGNEFYPSQQPSQELYDEEKKEIKMYVECEVLVNF